MKVETGSLAVNEITKKMCIIEEVKVEKQKQTLITKKKTKNKGILCDTSNSAKMDFVTIVDMLHHE